MNAMKCALLQVAVLTAVVIAAAACGHGLTATKWGPAGVASLQAAAIICLIAALLAAVLLGVVATYWPAYVGQAAFAGTAVRLLVTGALAIGYQVFADVHLTSFVAWLLILYLLLLLAETVLAIVLVRRRLPPPAAPGG